MSDRAWAGRAAPAQPSANADRAAALLAREDRQLVSLSAAERELIRHALNTVAGGYRVTEVTTIAQRRAMSDLVRSKFRRTTP
jgi:hypothetical protein